VEERHTSIVSVYLAGLNDTFGLCKSFTLC